MIPISLLKKLTNDPESIRKVRIEVRPSVTEKTNQSNINMQLKNCEK